MVRFKQVVTGGRTGADRAGWRDFALRHVHGFYEPGDPIPPTAWDEAAERARFEAFVGGMPFERDVTRSPDDDERFAFPGTYRDIGTDLAWRAWKEARKTPVSTGGEAD